MSHFDKECFVWGLIEGICNDGVVLTSSICQGLRVGAILTGSFCPGPFGVRWGTTQGYRNSLLLCSQLHIDILLIQLCFTC